MVLYVDDDLVVSNNEDIKKKFLGNLKKELKITVKPADYFLGLEIKREHDGSVSVSQTAYTNKILERFGMSNCKPVSTPIVKVVPNQGRLHRCILLILKNFHIDNQLAH